MSYYLILDDLRNFENINILCDDANKIAESWDKVLVKNYNEFVNTILNRGMPMKIYFDHDLGFEHQRDYFNVKKDEDKIIDPLKLNYSKYKERTGYDCAKWLVEYCMKQNKAFPEYYIHSMNSIGKVNIDEYIKCYLRSINK